MNLLKATIILLTTFLLFFRLGQPLLWQDEGEVAMIARNITKYGLPVAYDGNVLITQEGGQDSMLVGGQRLWNWNTWLPYYAVALSFKLFGENTIAARLPFALAGVGIMIISYLLAKKMRVHSLITLLILATNTLFYLYSRQARYYAFSMLFPLCAVYFFFSKRYWLYFLSLLASFHSNFVLAFGLNLPLIIIGIKKKQTWLFLAQAFFWLAYFHPAAKSGEPGFYRYWQGLSGVKYKITGYLNLINSFYFPLILSPLVIFIGKGNSILKLLITGSIFQIIIAGIFLQFGQRNLVTLIPVFSLCIGYFLSRIWDRNKVVFAGLLPLFMLTNIPFIVSEKVVHPSYLLATSKTRYYFADYLRSLPQDYPGPLEGISKFLIGENIKNSSTLIYTDYEINSLRFYFPNLRFVDHPSPDATYWLPRHSWGFLNELTVCQKNLIDDQAEKFVLDNFDTQWENVPDITYHQFTIDANTPHITIYKVTKEINWKPCDQK